MKRIIALAAFALALAIPAHAQDEVKGQVKQYTLQSSSTVSNTTLLGGGTISANIPYPYTNGTVIFQLPDESAPITVATDSVIPQITLLHTNPYYPVPIITGYTMSFHGVESDGESFDGSLVINYGYYTTHTYRSVYYHFTILGGTLTLVYK